MFNLNVYLHSRQGEWGWEWVGMGENVGGVGGSHSVVELFTS